MQESTDCQVTMAVSNGLLNNHNPIQPKADQFEELRPYFEQPTETPPVNDGQNIPASVAPKGESDSTDSSGRMAARLVSLVERARAELFTDSRGWAFITWR